MTEVDQAWQNNSPENFSQGGRETPSQEDANPGADETEQPCEDTPQDFSDIGSESNPGIRSNSTTELYTNGVTPLCQVVIQSAEAVAETAQAVESISQELSDENRVEDNTLIHDGNGHVTYTGYNLQPGGTLTQLTPVPAFESATGHLLPKEDVEAFFSNMDHPAATSVTLTTPSYAGTGNGEFTTLTNAGSLYHNLLTTQHQIVDNQGAYNMTTLYSNPRALMHYGGTTTGWQLSTAGDALYSSPGSSPSAGKYNYSISGDPGSPSSGRSDSVDIPRQNMQYTNFLSQDGGFNFTIPNNYGAPGKSFISYFKIVLPL